MTDRLIARTISLRAANDFVAEHHRHNGRTARNGGKFAVAAHYQGHLIGVAIVGNPLCAWFMDGLTAEVLRLCVSPDAPRNACSFLYGRAFQTWKAMGGTKLLTYTLKSETGASLRAAGFHVEAESHPHNAWKRKARDGRTRQEQPIYQEPKLRWARHVT